MVPAGRAAPSQRLEAAREAQRAFFNAALTGDTQSPVPTAPTGKPALTTGAAPPKGGLRPGSIIDIKV